MTRSPSGHPRESLASAAEATLRPNTGAVVVPASRRSPCRAALKFRYLSRQHRQLRRAASSRAATSSSRAAAASRSRTFASSSAATRPRSRAVSPDGDKGGVSGTSHHDQHIRTAIKPTRRTGPSKITQIPACLPAATLAELPQFKGAGH